MSYASNNPIVGTNNRSKRAEIPVTITANTSPGSIAATVDDPFTGVAEIFWANQAGSSSTAKGSVSGTATSSLDSSATFAVGALNCDQAQVNIGIVLLDAATEAPSGSVPAAGYSATATPAIGGSQKGTARYLRSAKFVCSEGALTSVDAGVVAAALRASLGTAGVTPNGNIVATLTFPKFFGVSTSANLAPTFKAAGTIKGIIELVWD